MASAVKNRTIQRRSPRRSLTSAPTLTPSAVTGEQTMPAGRHFVGKDVISTANNWYSKRVKKERQGQAMPSSTGAARQRRYARGVSRRSVPRTIWHADSGCILDEITLITCWSSSLAFYAASILLHWSDTSEVNNCDGCRLRDSLVNIQAFPKYFMFNFINYSGSHHSRLANSNTPGPWLQARAPFSYSPYNEESLNSQDSIRCGSAWWRSCCVEVEVNCSKSLSFPASPVS